MNAPDEVTLLVFKENFASRTFRVPLRWVSRAGFLLGLLTAIAALSLVFAVKYYRTAYRTDPVHVHELEEQLADLRAHPTPTVTVTAAAATLAPIATATATQTPAATGPVATTPTSPALLFSALPAGTALPPANPAEVPVAVSNDRTYWRGNRLRLQFDLQYVATDGGNQQGHIVLLARGPDSMFAYPLGVLNGSTEPALIDPAKGEYFSVSHLRQVRADFGPARSADALTEAEALIFSNDGKLLIHEVFKPERRAARAAAKPPVATGAAPQAQGSGTPASQAAPPGGPAGAIAEPATSAPPPASTGGPGSQDKKGN